MRKLTPTLTQSGLLAVLLQRQRYKISQLARRRAQREYMRAAPLEYPHLAVAGAYGTCARTPFAPRTSSDTSHAAVKSGLAKTYLRAQTFVAARSK